MIEMSSQSEIDIVNINSHKKDRRYPFHPASEFLAFWGLSALKKCHIGLHLSAFKWQFGPLWE